MKKLITFLVFSVAISSSLFAQKNQDKKVAKRVATYIETIESKISLSSEEKTQITTFKKAHTEALFKINEEHKDNAALKKEKRKEINKKFSTALKEAFGKDRSKEIIKASKKKKKAKKAKKGKKKKKQ